MKVSQFNTDYVKVKLSLMLYPQCLQNLTKCFAYLRWMHLECNNRLTWSLTHKTQLQKQLSSLEADFCMTLKSHNNLQLFYFNIVMYFLSETEY